MKYLPVLTILFFASFFFACTAELPESVNESAPPPAPPPPPPAFSELDQVLSKMETGEAVLDAPDRINIKDVKEVALILSMSDTMEELNRSITSEGEKINISLRVSNRMSAELNSSMFDVTPITSETQAISRVENTIWTWEIRPLAEGEHTLYLTLSALLEIDGSGSVRPIKTIRKTIVVEETTQQKVVQFVDENWRWLWAVVFFPAAGGVANRFRKRKLSNRSQNDDTE